MNYKKMGGYGKIMRKGMKKAEAGKSEFGKLSVKAGIDNNPNPTAADRIAGANKNKAQGGKSKMTENEIRFRRKKAQTAGNAAERVANLKQKKTTADDMGKEGKSKRIQGRIDRTTKRGTRRSKAATAGKTPAELKEIGIETSKEVKFGGPTKAKYGTPKKKKK